MSKSETELRELYNDFKSNGIESVVDVSVEERIQEFEQKAEELKQERFDTIEETGSSFHIQDNGESAAKVKASTAREFNEKLETGSVELIDFVEYLSVCEGMDIEASLIERLSR